MFSGTECDVWFRPKTQFLLVSLAVFHLSFNPMLNLCYLALCLASDLSQIFLCPPFSSTLLIHQVGFPRWDIVQRCQVPVCTEKTSPRRRPCRHNSKLHDVLGLHQHLNHRIISVIHFDIDNVMAPRLDAIKFL